MTLGPVSNPAAQWRVPPAAAAGAAARVGFAVASIGNVDGMAHLTVARRERAALADLFDAVGPDQPTLNEGWLTPDLLHHVIIRERRPDALLPQADQAAPFWAERVNARLDALPWAEHVDIFRRGPQWFSPLRLDRSTALLNTAEYFIHHEDVRRGLPGWTVRDLDPETTQAVTDQVRGLSRSSS